MRDQTVLLVNQAGEFLHISPDGFQLFATGQLGKDTDAFLDLKSKHFLADTDLETAVNLLATKLRTRKAFLKDFTQLHMVAVTGYCNFRCEYCQASSSSPEPGSLNMSRETARAVVDMIFRCPSPYVKIEFQGGEPLINWEVVRYIVEYAERVNRGVGKELEYVVCTNLTLLSEDMLRFLTAHSVQISTSLDGPGDLHDLHRVRRDGASGYQAFVEKLALVRSHPDAPTCSPLLTITRDHLPRLKEVIDEYIRLGFCGVFLRALNPYGLARAQWETLGYPVEDFVAAYKDVLSYIIELNLRGQRFVEFYTKLLLTRILTPFSTGFVDLQSPSGAGISGVIYDFDGDVYPADEGRMLARMGDKRFRLGNVHRDNYNGIFGGQALRQITASSCVETLPGCAWCAYQLYCGGDPIRNYVECGDIVGHRPTSAFCKRHMAIFDHLFGLIEEDRSEVMDVFWSWVSDRPLEEVRR